MGCNYQSCSGYMAPEYAMEGVFSVKSDVYSFGVLMLEVMSGRKNIGFLNMDRTAEPSVICMYSFVLYQTSSHFCDGCLTR